MAAVGLAGYAPANLPLPTQDELPYEDGESMETQLHFYQIALLLEALKLYWIGREDFYAGGDTFIYFSEQQIKKNDFRGPDFFLVQGVDGSRQRKSWVVWEEEGKTPDLIIELLSASTAEFDKTEKKQIYCDQVKVQEYFYYDPYSGELAGFTRQQGQYVPLTPTIGANRQEKFDSPITGLALVQWEGTYQGFTGTWLRWAKPDGTLLPTDREVAGQERLLKEQERLLKEQERLLKEQADARADQADAWAN
ncbi:MAG: Uma2 family endonuclease, partial [Acidobacteria bacterium]|nr:Uma2 family endonuclease [Acidobacteriota bacterium]